MNDISAYGRMMYDYGNMSVYFWDGLKQAEQDLRTKQDYSSAVAFDAAFHLYKQLQLLTYDSAIDYCQAIAEAPAGYILKYSVDDEIAGAVQMLSEKADWLEYECHEFPAEVINNGNNVYLSVQDYNPNQVYKMFKITDDMPGYYVEQIAYAEIVNLDAERVKAKL